MKLEDKIEEIENSFEYFDHCELFENLGSAIKTRNFELVLQLANDLILIDPRPTAEYYLYRGLATYKLGFLKAAVVDFTNCIEIDPEKQYRAYYYRGVCTDCILDFEKAAKMNYKPAKAFLKNFERLKKKNTA